MAFKPQVTKNQGKSHLFLFRCLCSVAFRRTAIGDSLLISRPCLRSWKGHTGIASRVTFVCDWIIRTTIWFIITFHIAQVEIVPGMRSRTTEGVSFSVRVSLRGPAAQCASKLWIPLWKCGQTFGRSIRCVIFAFSNFFVNCYGNSVKTLMDAFPRTENFLQNTKHGNMKSH